jgi:release factor glutamine methyltransferase
VHATCFATDVNHHAATATRRTLSQHGVSAAVVVTDLVDGLRTRLAGKVDILLFNPPYVPSPHGEIGGARLSAAWAGGLRGREVTDRLLPFVSGLLSPRGTFYMVAVTENDVPDIISVLRSHGLTARVALTRAADTEKLHIIAAEQARDHELKE